MKSCGQSAFITLGWVAMSAPAARRRVPCLIVPPVACRKKLGLLLSKVTLRTIQKHFNDWGIPAKNAA